MFSLRSGSSPFYITIIVGDHNRNVDEGTEEEYSVQQIISHEGYNSHTIDKDIALLKLSEDIQYNAAVSPVCLPKRDPTDGKMCVTTGWGSTQGRKKASISTYICLLLIFFMLYHVTLSIFLQPRLIFITQYDSIWTQYDSIWDCNERL